LPNTASDAEIAVAWAEAEDAFYLHLKTLENSSPSAYTESEIERLAEEYLRKKNLQRGLYADVVDPEVRAIEVEQRVHLQSDSSDYADHAIPEADFVRQELYKDDNRLPTVQEAAVLRAHQAVQTRKAITPKTLGMLWDSYLQHRNVDVSTRDGVRIQGRWDAMVGVIRDVKVSENTPDHIELGIEEFAQQELARGIAPPSILRNINEVLACFRWANRKYKLKWRPIERPELPKYRAKEKKPLVHQDQQRLVLDCINSNDWVSAAMLVMLQGGCMPSEVARLRVAEDLNLNAEIPHLVISGGDEGLTKKEARKRIVPIVLGNDVISQNLEEAITRLSSSRDPSATISKRLRTRIDPAYSSHCLRHTFRLNGVSSGANPQYLEAIGGWSGGNVNKIMLHYGAVGTEYSEVLKKLYEESLKIHSHLISTIAGEAT